MSGWPGKFVIGLTGNIATGKSVVRKMLEHLGAYGIDADALGHRAMAKGAPGYQPVLEAFGKWILAADGQIDRTRLGRVVFADAEALTLLEHIIHPLVGQAVDILVRRSRHSVIVIEAIKLLESELHTKCDAVWVTYAAPEIQLARLMQKRGMDQVTARQRIAAQPSQEAKTVGANVVIRNTGSFEDTWMQVAGAWEKAFPSIEPEPARLTPAAQGEFSVERARPRQAADIATLITRLSRGKRKLDRNDIMAAFGEKAFLILKISGEPIGVVGWKVENLVARTDDVYIQPAFASIAALRAMMNEVESASRELQCEASLLFLPKDFKLPDAELRSLGYQLRTVQGLGVRAWQEAAIESMPNASLLLFKQLRQDRVLRPV